MAAFDVSEALPVADSIADPDCFLPSVTSHLVPDRIRLPRAGELVSLIQILRSLRGDGVVDGLDKRGLVEPTRPGLAWFIWSP